MFLLCQISPSMQQWFAAWPRLVDARGYVGLISHILGHGSWEHVIGNFMLILLIGPILEERHGSVRLLILIVLTAVLTGLLHAALSDGLMIGSSGIAFMMILLASMVNVRSGEIPLTFLAVAAIHTNGELVRLFRSDGIAHSAHLIGGAAGAIFGFLGAQPRLALPTTPAKRQLATR
ncbi:MAG TPA: rhomboid family intramembrane serine protease [Kofleriaceae bacterium]